MVVKKSVHPHSLPGVHPGLQQKLREAEEAERHGRTPRAYEGPQKVARPTPNVSTQQRAQQVRTTGLVEPAYRVSADGLRAIAEQDAYLPGQNLDEIWDTLSETEKIRAGAVERFRLEMDTYLERSAMPWQLPHQMGGKLDARNLRRTEDNLNAEIDAFSYLLAPDVAALLRRFVSETRALLELCIQQNAIAGINASVMHDLLRDWLEKLIYQELVSRRRAMGDRGVRRIAANIDLAEPIYQHLQQVTSQALRQRLLMRIIHVHQDLGHTAYAARVSYRGSKLHRAYGARIFTDELNALRNLLRHKELQLCRSAVATHSSEELPLMESLVLAMVRAVDHLAPFAPHRVFKHLEGIDGVEDYLEDMSERARDGNIDAYLAAKDAFSEFLSHATELPPVLRDDIMAALRPFERGAEWVELGRCAGQVADIAVDVNPPGAVVAQLQPDPFAERYQGLFDVQQDQFLRLARQTDVSAETLQQAAVLEFRVEGHGALVVRKASG